MIEFTWSFSLAIYSIGIFLLGGLISWFTLCNSGMLNK